MNIQYTRSGDYIIPNLHLPKETRPIGKWGRMHREYLEKHHPIQYANLVLSCKLWTYLADLNEQAQKRLDTIICVEAQSPRLVSADSESILEMLYDIYAECNSFDNEIICEDFHKLYRLLNGMPLKAMDKITDPVSVLCRDHEMAEFIHGVQVGIRVAQQTKIVS